MAGIFRRKLTLVLLRNVAAGLAAEGCLLLIWPKLWVAAVGVAIIGAWAGWQSGKDVTGAVEEMQSAALAIVSGTELPQASGFAEFDSLRAALSTSARDLQRQLAASVELRQKLETLLDSMQDAVASVDAGGRVTWANVPMQRVTAHFSGTLRPGHALVHAIRAPEILQMVQAVLAKNEPTGPSRVSLYGRVVAASASPMPDGGALLVLHDVTLIEQVERTQRDFVANVSHELRTPLTCISGYAEVLLQDELLEASQEDTAREFLEIILKSAHRMERLTQDLLVLARVESGEQKLTPRPMRADALLHEAVQGVVAVVKEKEGTLEYGTVDEAEVLADPDAIVQVMSNLIENALNYGRGSRGAAVALSAETMEHEVCFTVRDFGAGIASEHLERVFERFYRVDKARSVESGGTGLGLAIAKHVIEEHAGRIWVESDLGRGSAFRFTLPRATAAYRPA